jgi:hypothetical protein
MGRHNLNSVDRHIHGGVYYIWCTVCHNLVLRKWCGLLEMWLPRRKGANLRGLVQHLCDASQILQAGP